MEEGIIALSDASPQCQEDGLWMCTLVLERGDS